MVYKITENQRVSVVQFLAICIEIRYPSVHNHILFDPIEGVNALLLVQKWQKEDRLVLESKCVDISLKYLLSIPWATFDS